jgi:hypothetical protein
MRQLIDQIKKQLKPGEDYFKNDDKEFTTILNSQEACLKR